MRRLLNLILGRPRTLGRNGAMRELLKKAKKERPGYGGEGMIGSGMWYASIAIDEQMEADPYWADSSEGQFALRLIKQENERLQRIIEAGRTRGGTKGGRS